MNDSNSGEDNNDDTNNNNKDNNHNNNNNRNSNNHKNGQVYGDSCGFGGTFNLDGEDGSRPPRVMSRDRLINILEEILRVVDGGMEMLKNSKLEDDCKKGPRNQD